jgi:hypothetical protein
MTRPPACTHDSVLTLRKCVKPMVADTWNGWFYCLSPLRLPHDVKRGELSDGPAVARGG